MRGEQYCLIARNVGLRRQHIKALRPRCARRGFQGERGNATCGHLADQFVVEGVEHADDHRAAFDQVQRLIVRCDDLENQFGRIGLVGVTDHCASSLVSAVRNAGMKARAALHRNPVTLADQLFDGFRGSSYPGFARLCFERNTNVHDKSPARFFIVRM